MTDKKQDEKSFDSSKINTQELQKYKQDYSEGQFIKCCSCGMFYRNLMCR